ncbi:hypothetical protein [Helicobacter rodentium]
MTESNFQTRFREHSGKDRRRN